MGFWFWFYRELRGVLHETIFCSQGKTAFSRLAVASMWSSTSKNSWTKSETSGLRSAGRKKKSNSLQEGFVRFLFLSTGFLWHHICEVVTPKGSSVNKLSFHLLPLVVPQIRNISRGPVLFFQILVEEGYPTANVFKKYWTLQVWLASLSRSQLA